MSGFVRVKSSLSNIYSEEKDYVFSTADLQVVCILKDNLSETSDLSI